MINILKVKIVSISITWWGIDTASYTWKSESESRSVVSDSLWPHGLYSLWNFPGQNTWVGSLSLLQGIFPSQGSNPGLPHCRQILYHWATGEALVVIKFIRGSKVRHLNTSSYLICRTLPIPLKTPGLSHNLPWKLGLGFVFNSPSRSKSV